jgi:PAS domain S-box-containing protein
MHKLKQLSVRKQVLFTFGTLGAVLLVIGGLFFFSLRSIERGNQLQQSRALNKLALIDDTAQDIGQIQAEVLQHILETDPGEMKRLDQNVSDIEKINAGEFADYQKFVVTQQERRLYDRVMRARKAYWEQTQPLLAFSRANRDAEAKQLFLSKQAPAYDEFLKAINELIKYVETDAGETAGATSRFISKIRMVGDDLVGVAILINLGIGLAVVRVARRLKDDNETLQNEIQDRKRTEEQLRVQSTALDAVANAIVITDHNGTIQSVNPAFTALTGYSAQEAVGQNPRILKSGQQDEAFYRNLWQTISSGQVWSGELTNRRKDGSFYVEEMTITPLRNADDVTARYIAIKQDITERKQAELEIQHQAAFARFNPNPVLELSAAGEINYFNQAAGAMAGALGLENTAQMLPPNTAAMVRECLASGTPKARVETQFGASLISWSFFPVKFTNTVHCYAGDITERKRLEAHLFQSQKMETVGKLAGGIAHEFNSIMTAILGQSELMLYDLPEGHPLRKNAAQIHQAADRAATLTRQLLAYGRKQILQPDILDLNTVLAGMENTLRHLAGHDVDVRITPSASPMLVKADPGQIEQVIVNIVMNAADAMPRGGKLTLETAETVLNPEYVSRFPDLKAGEYVMLAITDTGAGMSEAVKARLFEPFFTTKEVGKGTGLGLATCHGIIKQSGGHINVYSEPGRGATFKIYLPKAQLEKKAPAPPLQSPGLPHGTETILLVEDDPALREMAAELLGRLGYTVLTAGNGLEALNVTHQPATGHIDLLFTDVVMPHMSGKELADRVRALYPHTKILFTSAYTENAIVHQGVLNLGITLLQKPFTPSALAHKVREVLEQRNPS